MCRYGNLGGLWAGDLPLPDPPSSLLHLLLCLHTLPTVTSPLSQPPRVSRQFPWERLGRDKAGYWGQRSRSGWPGLPRQASGGAMATLPCSSQLLQGPLSTSPRAPLGDQSISWLPYPLGGVSHHYGPRHPSSCSDHLTRPMSSQGLLITQHSSISHLEWQLCLLFCLLGSQPILYAKDLQG